ncbi:hypothetical protein [Kribbella monticola]|uniref:hypothetical protein n=1 Tax=Kribbella monticola TaxID=2185285 RepID=UPI000DD3B8DF|nr:hypothetical protein [Kribbella monticola]
MLLALFSFSLGFTFGEYFADSQLDSAAFEAHVEVRPAVNDFTLRPGRLGPLRVGMSSRTAIATGYVHAVNEVCDVHYELSPKVVAALGGSDPGGTEFRDGSREDLDGILIKSPRARIPEGIGVGTTLKKLRATYQQRLKEVPGPLTESNPAPNLAIFGDGAAIIFGSFDGVSVKYIELVAGTSPQNINQQPWEC